MKTDAAYDINYRIVARPRGFEPLTARFVAEYSIQLSYGRSKNGGEGGIRTHGTSIKVRFLSRELV